MDGAGVVTAALLGYLLGSFPSADLASRIATRGGVDLRVAGSGNPGATNGAFYAIGAYVAATLVIAGHIVPPWNGFRGGKGVATSAGACLAVFPVYFPIYIGLAAAVAVASRSSKLAAQVSGAAWITAAVVWWAAALPNGWGPQAGFGLVAFVMAATAMILVKFALTPAAQLA